ncbi:mucin-19 [Anopheles nili]|uniref:mucin-19 n=1 Tax=Anopheles nili TaxID=185578 RepID=UPI00237B9AA7|nr:mucin-19 [Anopheles nili]
MGKEIDPADIGKHPDLIKKAQADIASCDVLVCGRCHSVFHLIELFREHKENEPDCKRASSSTLHDCDEAQAKVWAFLLWKSGQRNATGDEKTDGSNNSWKLYQTWVKLEESVRDTWIVAGKTIQSFSKTGAGNLQEMPVKITKTIVETGNDMQDKKPGMVNAQNRFAPMVRKPGDIKPNIIGSAVDPKTRVVVGAAMGGVKKPDGAKPGTTLTPARRSFATRTHPKTGVFSEEEVEKILAKRFSPIIKMHEYLVKWAKMTNDHNTWEPLTHLNTAQSILEHFEVQLAKQKEQRAATAARALQQQRLERAKPAGATAAGGTGAGTTTAGANTSPTASTASQLRPIRNSKASALDRVKLWTAGSRSPGDEETGQAGKRKLDEGESDGLNVGSDQDSMDAAKKPRTELGVNEALNKVSQSGNVKIVSMAGGVKSSAFAGATVNGTVSSPKDSNAAEVVILKSPKDGVSSGISKKPPGLVAGSPVTNRLSPRGEAKVKIVPKSDPGGMHGIFKIKTESTNSSPQSSPHAAASAAGPTILATSTTPAARAITIQAPSSTTDASGVTTRFIRRNVDGTEQLVKQTIRKATKFIPSTPAHQRQAIVGGKFATTGAPVPKITTTSAVGQQRTTLSPRVITSTQPKVMTSKVGTPGATSTPGTVVRTSTITRPGSVSSEQKINALRKQGLNVVKRVVTTSTVAGGKKPATEDDEGETESFSSSNLQLSTPSSPPRAMTLCPVTGKVLSQAEGEPTPVPSPEAEPEDKKALVKKEQSEQPGADGTSSDQQLMVAGGEQTDTQVQQLLTNEDGSPIIVAGEDGTLYQVAGKNAEGQTILIAQGADGEQSCVLVASQEGEEDATAAGTGVLTLDAAVSEAVSVPQEGPQLTEEQAAQYQQTVDTNQQLTIQTDDSQDGQITAEVVQADQPSPGGTRRVVLLLPDGSFMMTEVNEEQYQSLNLVN